MKTRKYVFKVIEAIELVLVENQDEDMLDIFLQPYYRNSSFTCLSWHRSLFYDSHS